MNLISTKAPYKIVADDGKRLRSKTDLYVAEHEEDGQLISEHIPYYSKIIYVPSSMTIEKAKELYEEEE